MNPRKLAVFLCLLIGLLCIAKGAEARSSSWGHSQYRKLPKGKNKFRVHKAHVRGIQ